MGTVIIGLDTSSALTSVAAVDEAGNLLTEFEHDDPRRHAEVMAPLLAQLVAAVDISRVSAIAVGVGPGPYTGLRVAIASGLALGMAWQVPVHGVCSLDAIAAERLAGSSVNPLIVASDARRSEAYWARYDASGRRVEGPRVSPRAEVDAELARPHAGWVARRLVALLAAGSADDVRAAMNDVPLDAHGEDSGATADALAGAGLLPPRPLYLRRPDAMPPAGVATGPS